jgi:hypothetical protein
MSALTTTMTLTEYNNLSPLSIGNFQISTKFFSYQNLDPRKCNKALPKPDFCHLGGKEAELRVLATGFALFGYATRPRASTPVPD